MRSHFVRCWTAVLFAFMLLAVPVSAKDSKGRPNWRISLDFPANQSDVRIGTANLEYRFGNTWDRLNEFGNTFLDGRRCPGTFHCGSPLWDLGSGNRNYPDQAGDFSGFGARPNFMPGDEYPLEAAKAITSSGRSGTAWGVSVETYLGSGGTWVGFSWHQSRTRNIVTREYADYLRVAAVHQTQFGATAEYVPYFNLRVGRRRYEREEALRLKTYFLSATVGYDVTRKSNYWSFSPLTGVRRAELSETRTTTENEFFYSHLLPTGSNQPSLLADMYNEPWKSTQYRAKYQGFVGAAVTWYPGTKDAGYGLTLRGERAFGSLNNDVVSERYFQEPTAFPVQMQDWQLSFSASVLF